MFGPAYGHRLLLLIIAGAMCCPARAAAEEAPPWKSRSWGWGGVPAIAYNSDDGLGLGAVGSIYRYDGATAPYKAAIGFEFFATSRDVHSHRVDLDLKRAGGLPLRLAARVEFSATRAGNFCGLVSGTFCDPAVAAAQADLLGLTGAARDRYEQRYFMVRAMQPGVALSGRYRIGRGTPKLEVVAGWRGSVLIPGDFDVRAPYAGSLYARTFPGGERGRISVVEAGVMIDGRDNEPAPSRGLWAEATVRGGGPWIGGEFGHIGANLIVRTYVPLLGRSTLVWANRIIADAIDGDVPTFEIARGGGTQYYELFGGQRVGRGVRLRGVLGKIRFVEQAELRWRMVGFSVFGVRVDLTALAFADLGHIAMTTAALFGPDAMTVATGGGGFRFAFDENFILRADVGFSPLERYEPGIYIDISHLW